MRMAAVFAGHDDRHMVAVRVHIGWFSRGKVARLTTETQPRLVETSTRPHPALTLADIKLWPITQRHWGTWSSRWALPLVEDWRAMIGWQGGGTSIPA
ncbi:hypothetical protein RRF57_010892 [Xylaria bambusicola]|uniref:Uncharacterized protein n=1 Tax=Xylaria bambusicola TaxID=326684 RepID=A0AAN7Z359_9PEZI